MTHHETTTGITLARGDAALVFRADGTYGVHTPPLDDEPIDHRSALFMALTMLEALSVENKAIVLALRQQVAMKLRP